MSDIDKSPKRTKSAKQPPNPPSSKPSQRPACRRITQMIDADQELRPKGCNVPINKSDFIMLIHKYRGNLSQVSDAMHCSRNALMRMAKLDGNSDILDALAEARERHLDDIEESVYTRAAETNDTTLQIFILKTQGKTRGWEQDEAKNSAKDIATAAFDFILNKSKNPAEHTKPTSP